VNTDLCTSDFHIHTAISPCADRSAGAAGYIEQAKRLGMTKLGFSNHFWDEDVPGASPFYSELSTARLQTLLPELESADIPEGMRVFFGCETEMPLDDSIALLPEHAPLFEYILIPTTHFNLKDLTISSSVKDPAEVGQLMVDRFLIAAQSELSRERRTALCHPFTPYGFFDVADELLGGITDGELEYCFSTAAGLGVPVEVNRKMLLAEGMSMDGSGFPYQFVRIMTVARECGCAIYHGTDSHSVRDLEFNAEGLFGRFARACGIEYSDLL